MPIETPSLGQFADPTPPDWSVLERKVKDSEEKDPARKVFVICFPKSGNTWLRTLLSRYKQITLGRAEFHFELYRVFANQPVYSPQFLVDHSTSLYPWSRRHFRRYWLYRLFRPGTDSTPPFDLTRCQGSKVVFMIRDPRDGIVSYFHHRSKQLRSKRFEGTISEFIRHPYFGIDRVIDFLNFLESERARFDHMFLAYEDLHADPAGEFRRVLAFGGMAIDESALRNAIEFGSLDNMRKLEAEGAIKLRVRRDPNDVDSHRVRKGEVGSHRAELTGEDIVFLEERIRLRLHAFYARYRA